MKYFVVYLFVYFQSFFHLGDLVKSLKIQFFSFSSYWICTLSNKFKCKMRVIAERGKPFCVRFKGPGHNHSELEYNQPFQKSSMMMGGLKALHDVKENVAGKSDVAMDSDME